MARLWQQDDALLYHYDAEMLRIEPWGENSLRVRATKAAAFSPENGALLPAAGESRIHITPEGASIENGCIRAVLTASGRLSFYRTDGVELLREYHRNFRNAGQLLCTSLNVEGREFRPIPGGDYHVTARFESLDAEEKIYGMGQYQQPYLNIKGADLELAHRNAQASVPFALSSRGYGFLWNNPAVGRAVFGKNITSFEALSTKELDYWVTAGDTPAQIEEQYAAVTGKAPVMPEYALGFWQCKLRYQTQQELLEVAREYKRRELPLSVIVIDFFHWPQQGDWRFDPTYWPNPDAMVAELKEMGVELMVSVWPTVDNRSENYPEMLEKGYLMRTDRGMRLGSDFMGNTIPVDMTNPEARTYLWQKIKENYVNKGIRLFWLDVAEPEFSAYDFDHYRYQMGSHLQVGNLYPRLYAKAFYEGQKAEGMESPLNLLRCAWAGSQRYGALVWSGDIPSSFDSLRNQIAAGLNMGLAGIPWWTTDIGGFHGGDSRDPAFRELLIRWFEYGAFCPVMRLHGDRQPHKPPLGDTGGAACSSGADNEVWSFGEEAYAICRQYLELRERMKPYLRRLMADAHEKGTPVMRPLFYDFPQDAAAWEVEDQYMFGPDVLVAPVAAGGVRARRVYLPVGADWLEAATGRVIAGGSWIEAEAPLSVIPYFFKNQHKVF